MNDGEVLYHRRGENSKTKSVRQNRNKKMSAPCTGRCHFHRTATTKLLPMMTVVPLCHYIIGDSFTCCVFVKKLRSVYMDRGA